MWGRHRGDAQAYERWHNAVAYAHPALPASWPPNPPMLGIVGETYQRAHRGTKTWVDFGTRIGCCDTWWPNASPPPRLTWVVVATHLYRPLQTPSGQDVIWIDQVLDVLPRKIIRRAERHARRLAAAATADIE